MPTDLIRYDLLVQDALRSVVRKVLGDAVRSGLPGEHHFNISFKTQAPGVSIPASVLQRYPNEMSIILQHEFWDLVVTPEAFEVSLNFSRKPERLIVPFDAITGFTDPSVPFGFKLEPRVGESRPPAEKPAAEKAGPTPRTETRAALDKPKAQPALRAAPRAGEPPVKTKEPKAAETKSLEAKPAAAEAKPPAGEAKVVSIDAFRKK